MASFSRHILYSLSFVCLLLSGCSDTVSLKSLAEDFGSPDDAYGTECWWWWLNGNVSKEAISSELNAMKDRHFRGAMIFDAGGHDQRGNKDIPTGPKFGSPEWNDLFVYALDEARRLELEIGFNIQSGWNLGGPPVTPVNAAKQVTISEVEVEGGGSRTVTLEKPRVNKDFYKDIAVLAFPVSEDEKSPAVTFLDYKSAVHELGGSAPDCRFLLDNERPDKRVEGKESYKVSLGGIRDLTDHLTEDGTLQWEFPEGRWVVMRVGFTCTNAAVSTSSDSWQGNVLDYMSSEAFDFYWKTVVDPILEAASDHVGKTLKYMETDSWECGGMNWTEGFQDDFKEYNGYDIISYLPVLGGYVVDDLVTSNAFLADFRKTVAHLVAENHYRLFAEYAHQRGIGIQPESAGPHAGPLDGLKNYSYSDIVMSEFWSPSPHRPEPPTRFFLKQASSAAHIYGKKIVAAESFTTIGPHWNDELWRDQKSAFDHEVCAGLNRVYLHTFSSSPAAMGLPGQEYFAGTHINPRVTWWGESGPFFDYLRRVQMIAQNGRFVADVLYYYGDHVPNVFPFKHSDPAGAIPGFDYDVVDETVLQRLTVKDGKVVTPTGMEYRVLVLPDHGVLSLEALRAVKGLADKGAVVLGPKPERLVSLKGGEEAREEFARLSNELSEKGLVGNIPARKYLMSNGIKMDFSIAGASDSDFDHIHYLIGGKDVYFVSNLTEEAKSVSCSFRVAGRQPELWDALSGTIREAVAFRQEDGLTTVPLEFGPYGSIIVVFDKKIGAQKNGEAYSNYQTFNHLLTVEGPWTIHFDPAWGGPESVVADTLADWTTSDDEGIKYYSGHALYEGSFEMESDPEEGVSYSLFLNDVQDVGIARVIINGTDKGIVWTKPFRVDISNELRKGHNSLEITVVNSWFNRVAGDEINPDGKTYTNTNIVLGHDYRGVKTDGIVLQPSGLFGPVEIKLSFSK
ncbi:MAG: glycoside hydrolase [Bacteroidales bacterium]|nr:glycoside hydrolase [Bacteroidales bacterium]